jgi:glycosyltransferase involved in cell wall biosynthesis
MMEVDIIIPVYNGEKFLRETLESVSGQILQFSRVIIINDASNDNSGNIIDEFVKKYSNFSSITFDTNRGLGNSLRVGINDSKADFVCILGHDDVIPRNYLLNIIEFLKPEISIVHTDDQIIDSKGQFVKMKDYYPFNLPFVLELTKGNFLFFQTMSNYISTVGIFLNRIDLLNINAFADIIIYNKSGNPIYTYDEYLTWIKLSNIGQILHLGKPKTFYRYHMDNMSNSIDFIRLESYNLQYKEHKKLALKILFKKENFIRVICFILYVYIPYLIRLRIGKFLKKLNSF